MARTRAQENESVQTIGHRPIEAIPEDGPTAAATITPVYEKGMSKGAEESLTSPKQLIKRYRVMEDKNVSQNGFRGILRAGKEIDHRGYNIKNLMQQGVKLQEIDAIEE